MFNILVSRAAPLIVKFVRCWPTPFNLGWRV